MFNERERNMNLRERSLEFSGIDVMESDEYITDGADNVKQDLLRYVEDKYEERFIIIDYGVNNGSSNKFDYVLVRNIDDRNKVFKVYRKKKISGYGYEYCDGYAYRLAESLMNIRIKNIVGNQFSNLKFETHITNGHTEYTHYNYNKNSIDLDEFLKNEQIHSNCVVEVMVTIE